MLDWAPRRGEAGRYLKTVQADRQGRFAVDCREVPAGMVMTATATAGGSTSEFNVVAGPTCEPILSALLAQTGPLVARTAASPHNNDSLQALIDHLDRCCIIHGLFEPTKCCWMDLP